MSAPTKPRYGFDQPAPPNWRFFVAWMVVGPVAIGGLLAAFTPLIVVTTPVATVLVLLIGWRGGFNASAFGALSGVGLGPVIVGCAFLAPNSGGTSLPWFLVGAFFIGAGIAAYLAVISAAPRPHSTDIRR